MDLKFPDKAPKLKFFKREIDYIIIIDNKAYKISTIGSCTYLGTNYQLQLYKQNTRIKFKDLPVTIQKYVLSILEKVYRY